MHIASGQLDKNFRKTADPKAALNYYNALETPFRLCGFAWYERDKVLWRLPRELMPQLADNLQTLAKCTSGGAIRFRTNSKTVALRAKLVYTVDNTNMPRSATSGFDLYVGDGRRMVFKKMTAAAEKELEIDTIIINYLSGETQECLINLPLRNGVTMLEIGLDADAHVEPPAPFALQNPVVFYGSSITQGACASRPGNAYTAHLSRWLNAEQINFGFSGHARGEIEVAQRIAECAMSAFVYDYDHNARSLEELESTYEPFYRTIRDKHPAIPVIMISRPDFDDCPEWNIKRRDIIRTAFNNARASGDENVYFIDGETLFGTKDRDACTVDATHPNDLGFIRIAEGVYPMLKQSLCR
ncbi:MAG: hypothetical protein GF398_20335 [Chitinivibrionales bacterium]|nr:hypothetical protein [Chitinivibrionales bacterium]